MRIATMTLAVVLMATAADAQPTYATEMKGATVPATMLAEQMDANSPAAFDVVATPTFTISDEVSKSLKEGDRLKIVGGEIVKDNAPTQAEKERDEAKAALAQCQDTLREIAPMAAARARQLFTAPEQPK